MKICCPKPSCHNQHLLRITGTDNYLCLTCEETYVLEDGRPALKDPMVKPKPKHGNKRVKVDGIWFDSQGEANYYCNLKLLRRANKIAWFCLQPKFVLLDGETTILYIADFIVCENDGKARVIDFKGFETKDFKIKKKLLEAQYNMRLELPTAENSL